VIARFTERLTACDHVHFVRVFTMFSIHRYQYSFIRLFSPCRCCCHYHCYGYCYHCSCFCCCYCLEYLGGIISWSLLAVSNDEGSDAGFMISLVRASAASGRRRMWCVLIDSCLMVFVAMSNLKVSHIYRGWCGVM
jgi:hypothetical protein